MKGNVHVNAAVPEGGSLRQLFQGVWPGVRLFEKGGAFSPFLGGSWRLPSLTVGH